MKTQVARLSAVLLTTVIIIGCGSIMHGTRQEVSFQTAPEGAVIEVSDAMGVSYGSCETPCTLDLKRKKEYHVTVTKSGYEPADFIIERKTSGWIWGNILLGGVIGLVIDLTNGAAYKLSPETLQLTLQKGETGAIIPRGDLDAVVILDIENLNAEQRALIMSLERIPLSSLK